MGPVGFVIIIGMLGLLTAFILHVVTQIWSNAHCVLKNLNQMNYYKNIW